MTKTLTKGNVVVEDIKICDIHYEYDMGLGMKVQVISLPVRTKDGRWTWRSKQISTGRIIDYVVTEGNSHYAPNLYDYPAYNVKIYL